MNKWSYHTENGHVYISAYIAKRVVLEARQSPRWTAVSDLLTPLNSEYVTFYI